MEKRERERERESSCACCCGEETIRNDLSFVITSNRVVVQNRKKKDTEKER